MRYADALQQSRDPLSRPRDDATPRHRPYEAYIERLSGLLDGDDETVVTHPPG